MRKKYLWLHTIMSRRVLFVAKKNVFLIISQGNGNCSRGNMYTNTYIKIKQENDEKYKIYCRVRAHHYPCSSFLSFFF